MQPVDLIDINDVTEIFGKSIEQIRNYKRLGLIRHCKRVGRKDFFDRSDVMLRKNYIDDQINRGKKLDEIAVLIREFEKTLPSYLNFKENQKRILIVDDYEPLCDVYTKMIFKKFSKDDIAILSAHDGEHALELAQKTAPDLVILDIALKKDAMSGIDLYEKLKQNPLTEHSKFVFISSVIEYHQVDTDFLPKPIDFEKLFKIIAAILPST